MTAHADHARVGDLVFIAALAQGQTSLTRGQVAAARQDWIAAFEQGNAESGVTLRLAGVPLNRPDLWAQGELTQVQLPDGSQGWSWGDFFTVVHLDPNGDPELIKQLEDDQPGNSLVPGFILGAVILGIVAIAVAQFAAIPLLKQWNVTGENLSRSAREALDKLPDPKALGPILAVLAVAVLAWVLTRAPRSNPT